MEARQDKVVVLPDVHDKYAKAEALIARESPCSVVFLGDYFDGRGEDPEGTAEWLAGSMAKPERIHLLGNHDMHYLCDNLDLRSSGYDSLVLKDIQAARVPWEKAAPYCWLDETLLCTHAGLSAALVRSVAGSDSAADAKSVIGKAYNQLEAAKSGGDAPLFGIGRKRGGPQETGGITWCDYAEFEDIAGIRQIFGHTRDFDVRTRIVGDTGHYCIDTELRHYAVYANGKVAIKAA